MVHQVLMPRLSDSMETGVVIRWLKSVGEEIAVGEELVEIETDKANMAYESDVAGTLTEVLANEGETLVIGAPLAVVGDGSAASALPAAAKEKGGLPPGSPPEAASTSAPKSVTGSAGRAKASPLARRLAAERGVDLATLQGTGPGGRIVKADVEGAVVPKAATPSRAAGETIKGKTTYEELSRLQETIARRMAEAKATAPHFYLEMTVEMTSAVENRTKLKDRAAGGIVPSLNDMAVKACALALKEFPRVNGAYTDGRFELYSRVNIGVAVAAEDALVVPIVLDADEKGLLQIADETRALAAKVRAGTVTPPELAGGTFTVSNLGMYGIDSFNAIVDPPQAAILALGAVVERPVVLNGEIATGKFLKATLSCDHRILDGAIAARFLARVRELLEEPLGLAG